MNNKRLPRNAIKEAFDNLLSGVSFFNKSGILILCNKQMYRLGYELTGRSLQVISDLTNALERLPKDSKVIKDKNDYVFTDGSVWRFSSKEIRSDQIYTEYIATNVTDIYEKKKALEQRAVEKMQMADNLRNITKNVVAITREEEILTMKMQIHGKVGETLQKIRCFHAKDCPKEEKQNIISDLESVVKLLAGEIGNSDEADVLEELLRLAESLGIKVVINGEIPREEKQRNVIIMAIRECLTNTIRHGKGNEVVVDVVSKETFVQVKITNNGIVPKERIIEGGGLTSLRKRIEKIGGQMIVESLPRFTLRIML